jgi:hypothetical protein
LILLNSLVGIITLSCFIKFQLIYKIIFYFLNFFININMIIIIIYNRNKKLQFIEDKEHNNINEKNELFE